PPLEVGHSLFKSLLYTESQLPLGDESALTPLERENKEIKNLGNNLFFLVCFSEIEAKEACDWLRAAGFPQYAQLYEDSQFPIDISAVKKDHDFLDRDLVEPLCRRLNTLNKCAPMKLDVGFPKKRVRFI
uniref:StAR-related lipid transfer (START) domain containing 13a n=1 Tax=Astyanax mexicanus TaxID=7994 RepID=A0A8B9GXW8_ASTMX